MTRNLLDRLDAAINNLCPCGAEPRTDSAYCSYDCEPTHRSIHTTSDTDGTQMRWRPDLLTAHDDTGLHNLGTMTWYSGPHNARLYQRGIPEQGQPTTWHLRLDDGHRYVGLDLNIDTPINVLSDDHKQRMTDAWSRLEQELGNRRHIEPDHNHQATLNLWHLQRQTQADRQRAEHTRQQICAWLRANQLDPDVIPDGSPIRIHNSQITVDVYLRDNQGRLQLDGGEPVTEPHTVPLIQPWPDGLHYHNVHTDHSSQIGWYNLPFDTPVQVRVEQLPNFGPTLYRIEQALRRFHTGIAPIVDRMHYFIDVAFEPQPEPEPADHPLNRVRAQHRNQPHGPQQPQRPPRHLNR